MALIFTNGLTNIVSDAGQYRCVINGSLVVYETHMREPQLREGNDEDPVWFDFFDSAIPKIGKIQGQKSLLEILDRFSRPKKLENHTLPNFLFGWTMKEEMAANSICPLELLQIF